MRDPLGAKGAMLGDFAIGSMAAALGGQPRRGRRSPADGAFPAAGAGLELDFENDRYWVFGAGAVALAAMCTRASVAWAFDASGVLQPFAANVPRRVPSPSGAMSLLQELTSTNKCTNHNAEPNGSLTNITKTGDAASTLTEVDDAAELAAAGLSVVCSSGKVFKLDNSAGVSNALATVTGTTANTNKHSISCWARITAGAGLMRLTDGSVAVGDTSFSGATYVRYVAENLTPNSSTAQFSAQVGAGGVCYFILNQLEEKVIATTPIVTAGSQVTRATDAVSVAQAVVTSSGAMLVDFTVAHAYSAVVETFAELDDGTLNNRVQFLRSSSASSRVVVSSGGASQMDDGTTAATTGRTRRAIRVSANNARQAVDGVLGTADTSLTLPAGMNRLRFGLAIGSTAVLQMYLHGARLFERPLTDSQLLAITRP